MAVAKARAMFDKPNETDITPIKLNRTNFKQWFENRKEEEEEKKSPRTRCKEVFDCFDADSNGNIDHKEFYEMCISLGREITIDQAKEALSKLDLNNDGVIDFEEFF